MGVYIVRRLLWLPFLLFAVTLLTFALGRFGPGDPVAVMLGNRYTEERAKPLRKALGLDRPFFVQYGDYMWGAIRGDLGESLRFRGRAVRDLLGPKIWVSVQVNLAAMSVSLAIGLPLGFMIAHKQGTWIDPTTVTTFIVIMSIPIMVTIPFLMWAFCLKLDMVPCSGWGGFWDLRMIIPAVSMGILGVAGLARLMRASTLDVMGQDFIRTAYAKGLSTLTVDSRHILKNAMIPIITVPLVFPGGDLHHELHRREDRRVPGRREPVDRLHIQQGLSRHHGLCHNRVDRVRAGEPVGRHLVRLHRPQDPLPLEAIEKWR